MKRITRKAMKKFTDDVAEFLLSKGAKNVPPLFPNSDMRQFTLDTWAGELTVSLRTDHTYAYSVYCRFTDVQTACSVLLADDRLNRNSGKWNWHSEEAEPLLTGFKRKIVSIAK